MQVKFLKKDGFDYKFLLQNTRNDIVNAIRRTIMLHVPVFATKEIAVYKNESVMSDEMLAHRIGLVPIYSDDLDDKEHHLYLKKTGGTVYSGDITGNLEISLKEIPLVILNDGKTLEIELTVGKGTGYDHVKFSPANVFFNNIAAIKQNANVEDISSVCPGELLEKKADKIFLKEPYECSVCRYCETKTNHAIELILSDSDFVLTITPFGNLDLDTIVKSCIDYLCNELNELKQQLQGKSLSKEVQDKPKKTKKSKQANPEL